jgi:hypothetical protein
MATLHEIVLKIEDYRGELRQPGSAGQGQSAHRPRLLRILHCDDARSIQSLNLSCSNSSFRRDSMSQPGNLYLEGYMCQTWQVIGRSSSPSTHRLPLLMPARAGTESQRRGHHVTARRGRLKIPKLLHPLVRRGPESSSTAGSPRLPTLPFRAPPQPSYACIASCCLCAASAARAWFPEGVEGGREIN